MTAPSPLLNLDLRIHSYGTFLRRHFGCRVSKVNVDAGFTCPNRDGSRGIGGCIYCDNSSFSPDSTQASISIEDQFTAGARYHRKRLASEKFIVYFQKFTNTYGPVEQLRNLYSRALNLPDVVGISIGTRPDALEDGAIDLLADLARTHYVCIELGLQSMDDTILEQINRGHSLDEYLSAVKRLSGRGIDICTHLIHGFHGETAVGFIATAELMNRLPINSLKLHQLHAVKETHLADLYSRGEFTPISHKDYVATACDFLEKLRPDIAIQRLYGSAPLAIRVAPTWDLKNNQMWYSIINELKRRGTWQGCRAT